MYLVVYGIVSGLFLAWFFGVWNSEFETSVFAVAGFEIINFAGMLHLLFKAASYVNESTSD